MKLTVTFTLTLDRVAGNQSRAPVDYLSRGFLQSLLFTEKFNMCFQFHFLSKMRYRTKY